MIFKVHLLILFGNLSMNQPSGIFLPRDELTFFNPNHSVRHMHGVVFYLKKEPNFALNYSIKNLGSLIYVLRDFTSFTVLLLLLLCVQFVYII